MDTILQKTIALAVDYEESHKEEGVPYAAYGRGVEQASALGLWFVAYTLIFSSYASAEFMDISSYLWAYMAFILGLCQFLYNKVAQRVVFTIFASAFWLSIAIHCFIDAGDWNLATAASLPLAIFNFYVYGFVYEVWKEKQKRKR